MAISVLDTAYGRMLLPDTDDSQFTWLQMTGAAFEDADIRLVRDIIDERPRGTIIDAGASFGTWSLALASHAERVLAFEPQLEIFGLLQGTLALNRLSRKAAAYNCALWSKCWGFDIESLDLDQPNNFGG